MNAELRRLAAIMFTDIAGYSTMVNTDEALALKKLREHQEIVRRTLPRFNGREIDTAGDGFAVEFPSAKDAVLCGIELQKCFAEHNDSVSPEQRIHLRIGIHLSDVVEFSSEQKKGIYGDGVNIAARLQPLAPLGGICISRAIRDQVQQIDCSIISLGPQKLKGIKQSVTAYAIVLGEKTHLGATRRRALRSKIAAVAVVFLAAVSYLVHKSFFSSGPVLPGQLPRILVMPLDEVGISEDERFLAAGLTGGLISSLTVKGLRVLSYDSAYELKVKNSSLQTLVHDLNIGTVIKGQIFRQGSNYRVQLAIIDPATEQMRWSKEFMGHDDSFSTLQAEMNSAVQSQLQSRSISSIPNSMPDLHEPSKEAYVAFMRGSHHLSRRTKDSLFEATREFEASIAADPAYADAYARLALTASMESYYGFRPPMESALRLVKNATRAIELDPGSTEGILALAEEKFYVEFDASDAERLYLRAIASHPRSAVAHQWYAEFLIYRKRFKESQVELDRALELDPVSPAANTTNGCLRYFNRRYPEAVAIFEKVLQLEPNFMIGYYWLGRAQIENGEPTKAVASLKKAVALSNDQPMMLASLAVAQAKLGQRRDVQNILVRLNELSHSSYVSDYDLAIVQLVLNDDRGAIRSIEKVILERQNQTSFLSVDPQLDPLRDREDFKSMVASIKPRPI